MKIALALALVLPLSGCATAGYRMGNFGADPAYEPQSMPAPQVVDADGAIIVRGASIYSGRRAMAVGDHLTVRIAHNTSADSKANTSTNKTSAAELGVSSLFGLETQIADAGMDPTLQLKGSAGSTFSGDGTTNRSGALSGTLTVRVVDVEPNGTLVIGGRQAVKINNEVQVLNLRGRVDPRAVQPDNSVASSQIVDARIEYSGVGVVAGKQRPGWLTRILDVISPF